ncbi:VOC family protein [Leeuwenhoekiella sp. H156]|uniref:VOC family protein n=1 Tax=Leeuwenhoekiella sp. H156 TaxID=3450128 RepID=UPI003FA4BCE4
MRHRVLLLLAFFGFALVSKAQESNFKPGALTVAVVASDEQQSLHFYKDILGLHEVGSFTVDAPFATRLGLSQGLPFKVTRLAFDTIPGSSQLKIASFDLPKAEVDSVKAGIQQQLGLQYLTLQVYTLDGIMEAIKKEGVQPEADTPIKLGENNYLLLLRDPDGVFIEVIGDYSNGN